MNIPFDLLDVIEIGGGAVIMLQGRRFFQWSVGFIGFIFGAALAGFLFRHVGGWTALGYAVIAGLIGMLAAFRVRDFIVGIIGFLGGGLFALGIIDIVRNQLTFTGLDWPDLVVFLVGGIVGWLMIELLFDWTMVVLTAFLGANTLVSALDRLVGIPAPVAVLLLIILGVLGTSVQARPLRTRSGHRQAQPAMPRLQRSESNQ